MDLGLDGGGEEGKGKASYPEPVWNELREVHAEEDGVHLASDVEDKGGKGEWIKEWVEGGWVEGAIRSIEWLEEGSEAVGGRVSGSEADEGNGGGRRRGGGCRSSILEESLDSFVRSRQERREAEKKTDKDAGRR